MTEQQFPAWAAVSKQGFAAQQVESGSMPAAEASAYAEEQFPQLLPDGLNTPGQHIWTVHETDNGHDEVGYLWIRVREEPDGLEAFVFDVALRPECRGRGLGRATMEAGEAEARRLGAVSMRLNVFGHNAAAVGLYERLGYQPSAFFMTRRLDRTDPVTYAGGPPISLVPMDQRDFDRYRRVAEQEYAANIAESGMLPAERARAKAADDYQRLLPDGMATADHFFWTGYHDGEEVGMLWLNIVEKSDGRHAFGYDFSVPERARRRGYGRSIMVAAENLCRDRGVVSIGLSVFAFNRGARALYEQMGFELGAQLMRKRL